jgi:hypothetical protein
LIGKADGPGHPLCFFGAKARRRNASAAVGSAFGRAKTDDFVASVYGATVYKKAVFSRFYARGRW